MNEAVLRLLTDEDFDRRVTRGLLRRLPGLDLVRAQEMGLSGSEDSSVLDSALASGRLLLTHDANTMVGLAYGKIAAGSAIPGIFVVPQSLSIGRAIDEIELIVETSHPEEWDGRVTHLPL